MDIIELAICYHNYVLDPIRKCVETGKVKYLVHLSILKGKQNKKKNELKITTTGSTVVL